MGEKSVVEQPKISEDEALRLLTSIVRGVSRDYRIAVKPIQETDAYFDWQNHYVGVNLKNLDRDLDVLRGMSAHEGKHVAITSMDMVPKEDWENVGFRQLMQTVEDVRVNSSTERDLPGAGEWIRTAVIDMTKEGEDRNIKEITKKVAGGLGFTPRSAEYCLALQNTWALNEYGIPMSSDAKLALDLSMPWIEKIKGDVPYPDAKKSEVRESMWRNYVIQKTQLWPIYGELVEKDKKDIEDLQFIKYLASEEGNDELEIIKMDLTDEEREELDKIVGETRVKFPKPPEMSKKEESNELGFMDIAQMSSSLRQKLDSAKKQINNKKQNDFKKEAEDQLKEIEDKIVEALRGRLQDPKNNETHEEELKRLLKSNVMQNAMDQAMQDIESSKKPEKPPSRYQELLNQVSDEIDLLVNNLEEVLIPNKFPRWKKGYPTGERLSLTKVMQYQADKRGYDKLWERKTLPHKKDYGITLLLDLSGSMDQNIMDEYNGSRVLGNRLTEALKTVVIFSEALNKLGIPFEVVGYSSPYEYDEDGRSKKTNKLKILKDFREEFGETVRDRIGSVSVGGADGTPTGWAMKEASSRILDYGSKQPIILNITDGRPDDDDILKEVVGEIGDTTNQLVIGLGIGPGIETSSIEGVYPSGKHIPNVKDLPFEVSNILQVAIQ